MYYLKNYCLKIKLCILGQGVLCYLNSLTVAIWELPTRIEFQNTMSKSFYIANIVLQILIYISVFTII